MKIEAEYIHSSLFLCQQKVPVFVLTCLMAVTVMTKKRGRPLVTGEVGVSIINWENKWKSRNSKT